MSNHILNGFIPYVIRHFARSHTSINLRCLDKSPEIIQFDYIIVHNNGSIQNFSRGRINPARSHCIRCWIRRIANARIFQIVRIKFRIIFWEIIYLHNIFESYFFKSLIPSQNSFTNSRFPLLRESIIHIPDYRFHRFHQFSFFPSFHVGWFYSPTIYQCEYPHTILFLCQIHFQQS